MHQPIDIENFGQARLQKDSIETCLSTLSSNVEFLFVDTEECLKACQVSHVVNSVVKRVYNSDFSSIEAFSRAKGFLTVSEMQQAKLFRLSHKSILLKAVKQMLWTGHIKLIQRPFLIWKILNKEKSKLKSLFVRRNEKLALRSLVNRTINFYILHLKKIFERIKSFSFHFMRKHHSAKNKRKTRQKRFKKVCNVRFNNGYLKTIIRIFQLFSAKMIRKYWQGWKSYECYYEEGTEEVNHKELRVRNFQLLSKPLIELVYYDRNQINPGLEGYLNCINHLYKSQKRSALNKIKHIANFSKQKINAMNAYYFLNSGNKPYRFWKIARRLKAIEEEEIFDKRHRIFGVRRASFLHVYKILRLELIFLTGQYFTEIKKNLYRL